MIRRAYAIEAGEAGREDRRSHAGRGAPGERHERDAGWDRDEERDLVEPTAQTRLGRVHRCTIGGSETWPVGRRRGEGHLPDLAHRTDRHIRRHRARR